MLFMYIPSSNLDTPQEQEIVCVLTGESFVHVEGGKSSIIDPKHLNGSVDRLPSRFYSTPWVIRDSQGRIRVFSRFE
jgi:hypothetical protein